MPSWPGDNVLSVDAVSITGAPDTTGTVATASPDGDAAQPSLGVHALLDLILTESGGMKRHDPPWGIWKAISVPSMDITVKHLQVFTDSRTSLQVHRRKREIIIVLSGLSDTGFVELGPDADHLERRDDGIIEIQPGVIHRVTGPLEYIEVSTYDADDDTIRLVDDYGRV